MLEKASELFLAFLQKNGMVQLLESAGMACFGEGDAGKRIKNVLNFKKPQKQMWLPLGYQLLAVGMVLRLLMKQKLRLT